MKANELQIGDWIQNTNGNKGKVIGFRYDVDSKNNEIVVSYKENDITWSQPSLIEPILLTREILNVNGFVCKNKKLGIFELKTFLNTKYTYAYHIKVDLDSSWVTIEYGDIDIFKNISCVHILQQAIRLGGQKELADNFKIE